MEPESNCTQLDSHRNSDGCYCLSECMQHFIDCSGMNEIIKVAGPPLQEGSSTQEMSSIMEVDYCFQDQPQSSQAQVDECSLQDIQGQLQSSQPDSHLDEKDSDEGLDLTVNHSSNAINGIL